MIAALKLIPCLIAGALVIWAHEHFAQTWAPMFHLICLSLALSAAIAWWFFRRALKATRQRQWKARHCLAVFVFFASWILFWAVAEEALIAWTLAEYGNDDTGGRYFYPGHSGMGYADGLRHPIRLLWKIGLLALPAAWLIGMPMALIGRKKQIHSQS